jgi:fucose permease
MLKINCHARAIILLIVIYLAFISLGLPDALLGAAWPMMRLDIHAQLSAAGIISLIICAGTVISSLTSNRIIHGFGTGRVTLASVLMTAVALSAMARAGSLLHLCLLAIPLGLGAGSVDAALNNFVALHYKAMHMNWLHCFWGVGATAGPLLLSKLMEGNAGWRGGYSIIGVVQFCVASILFLSMPLWVKNNETQPEPEESDPRDSLPITNSRALRVPGIKHALAAFFCYCGFELSAGLWAASYLVEQKALPGTTAATWASLYYGAITAGRFASGFFSIKLSGSRLIRLGCSVCLLGVFVLLLPLPAIFSLVGFILMGLGCAPFYPAMIHETPARFGAKSSQAAMGLQMASAYVGNTFLPPLAGELANRFSLSVLPWFLLALVAGMFFFSEMIAKRKIKPIDIGMLKRNEAQNS